MDALSVAVVVARLLMTTAAASVGTAVGVGVVGVPAASGVGRQCISKGWMGVSAAKSKQKTNKNEFITVISRPQHTLLSRTSQDKLQR